MTKETKAGLLATFYALIITLALWFGGCWLLEVLI